METINEKERQTPVTGKYGVLVAGGGIAGISAALSAARNGADVLLVERECLLGGLATLGLITIYLPLCDGMGNQVSFGIAEELLRLSIKHGAEDRYPAAWLDGSDPEARKKQRFQVQYNPHLFALEAEKLLLNEGVKILYNTHICGTIVENRKITHIILENKGGRSAIAVRSVVDATGDADVCLLSGEETVTFKQQNVLAAWYYFINNGKIGLKMLGYADTPDEYKKKDSPNLLVNRRFSGLGGFENSEMICLSHEQMLKDILNKRQNDASYLPVILPTIPQVRMTRRIAGAYTMDDKEIGKGFPDGIGMISDWRKSGPVYELPFSVLYGNRIDNLITAGRCISVTDSMWDITRVIPPCAVTGQAAGTAAAMTDNFAKLNTVKLREILANNGLFKAERLLQL